MEDPAKELRQVVRDLTECNDAALHRATVDKYLLLQRKIGRLTMIYVLLMTLHFSFLPTAAFEHPLCNVTSGPNSRDTIKRVYAVYKVLSKDIRIEFQDISFDKSTSRAVIELEESGSSPFDYFNLMRLKRMKIVTILDLWRDTSGDGKYYIAKQYDVFPIDKIFEVLPFGFLYNWWRRLATMTGDVVGTIFQISGAWATA